MSNARNVTPIQANKIYHIYNRAIGNEKMFLSGKDYLKFLDNIKRSLLPSAEIFAYCLLPNHFHFLIQVNASPENFSKGMSDICNGYAKYFNLKYSRRGGLFMTPFKRRQIDNDASLSWITWYIHRNPLHHGYTKDWQNWAWSSYKAYTGDFKTLIKTAFLLDFFGGREQLIRLHQVNHQGWIDDEME